MLDTTLKSQLKAYAEKIIYPIDLIASLDQSEKSKELQALLSDIAESSDNIGIIERWDSAERSPSFKIQRRDSEIAVSFAGLPLGHEFTSLVLALLQVGGHPVKLDPSVVEQIKALEGEYRFETYISLSCHNCPEVVQALNAMSVINPNIKVVAIDGGVFPSEVEEKNIMAVPMMFLNDEHFGQGRTSVEEILAKLDVAGSKAKKAEALQGKGVFDTLIIGGGPAGAAAAVYAARKGIKVGVVADRFGGQVLDTLAIENFVSVRQTEGPKFATALEEHVKEYNVDIMNGQRVVGLSANSNEASSLLSVTTESGGVLQSKTVILATGARWREMGVPGEKEYKNHGVAYCPHCDGPLFKGKRVAVVGGGNSGVEAAIDLAGLTQSVTLLEYADTLKADAVLVKKLKSLPNVTIILNAQTSEVLGDGQKVSALAYKDRLSGEAHRIDLEGVFVQIGLIPNTEWLKETLTLSRFGEIEVTTKGETSLKGVFAAGDATTTPFKQIIIAAGDGAKSALSAFDHLIRQSVE